MSRALRFGVLLHCFGMTPVIAASGQAAPPAAPATATAPATAPATTPATAPATLPGVLPAAGPNSSSPFTLIPITPPELSPGVVKLLELEGRFAQEVAEGGGKAFASWFAEDAVTLSNGKPVVMGRGAIEQDANWSPREYQLTWLAQGAQMGPSGDMGFTWGHYEGRATGPKGEPVIKTGRYITIWKKLPDGTWKVALDASADEPPAPSDCCSVVKPQ